MSAEETLREAIKSLDDAQSTLATAKKRLKYAEWTLMAAFAVLGWAIANWIYIYLK